MQTIIKNIEQSYLKNALPQVQSGDSVRVHQVIREGSKKRVQIFHGVVIRTHRPHELTANITVRRIASGIGVEKTFLLHSPNVTKIEVVRRGKVRRNFLSYLRGRRGKSARLQDIAFDRNTVNVSEESSSSAVASVQKAEDEELRDAEVTELAEEQSVSKDASTESVAKEENRAAAADDESSPVEDVNAAEENQLSAEEFQSGVDRAEDEDTRAQKPVE
jgi:large subunit ribosomal protein L19